MKYFISVASYISNLEAYFIQRKIFSWLFVFWFGICDILYLENQVRLFLKWSVYKMNVFFCDGFPLRGRECSPVFSQFFTRRGTVKLYNEGIFCCVSFWACGRILGIFWVFWKFVSKFFPFDLSTSIVYEYRAHSRKRYP